MTASHILAIDQGTSSTRAIVFDDEARPVGSAQLPLRQHYPHPGWVEHDPLEIAAAAVDVAGRAVADAGLRYADIAALGITNQRETTVVWDRRTGEPVAPAIVWQCRRTAEACETLVNDGYLEDVRFRTGLNIDPYFSATKLRWLLDRIPGGQARAEDGDLCFGTVDSWLLFRLTGGGVHATDVTNAGRTMLLNIWDLRWDEALLDLFDVPEAMLPEVRPSAGEFGTTAPGVLGAEVPVAGIAGDQQAALFGQACHRREMTNCTYGTGAFVLANAGGKPVSPPPSGLLSTVAWQVGARRAYALEGSVFSTGATVQWLRDELGLIQSAEESARAADSVPDNGGVYFVPAFSGLGAPHWEPRARGAIVGLTRGATDRHIVRAALEATAYRIRDVLEAMNRGASQAPLSLRAGGGQTANEFLMQFQADILGIPVEVAAVQETSALGAAMLAGIGAGVWKNEAELARIWSAGRTYEPSMTSGERLDLYAGWKRALQRSLPDRDAL